MSELERIEIELANQHAITMEIDAQSRSLQKRIQELADEETYVRS